MATTENNVVIQYELKLIEPQSWHSFGSELEIEKEKVDDTRRKMKFSLKRQLKYFGSAVQFSDSTASDEKKNSVDFAPSVDKAFNLHMKQQNKNTHIVITLQDVACQTDTPTSSNIWAQYSPREFTDEERTAILNSDGIKDFLANAIPRLQDAMEQSDIFDVFKDDFEILGENLISRVGRLKL